MKTILFLLTSFLPAFTFAQSIATSVKFNCHLNEADFVVCERKPSYYYQNKIIEDTEKRKIEIRLLINKSLLMLALEESLSEGGNAVKIHSIEAQNLTEENELHISGTGFIFSLNMTISSENIPPLNVVCSAELYEGAYSNSLEVKNCTEEQELLTFADQILYITNRISPHQGEASSNLPKFDYYRPIVRITQVTQKRGPCQSKVFLTEQGCQKYEENEISKIETGVYKKR